MDAARLGLPRFLKAIPPEELGHLNFADPSEVEVAELGTPFRQFTIAPQQILAYEPAIPLDQIVVPLPIWHFPVVVAGETRTLLSVEMMHGIWQAVGIGSSGLGKLWTASQGLRPTTDGYVNVFVWIAHAHAAFVLSTKDGSVQMVPLESAGTPTVLRQGHDAADVIVSLQPSVKRRLGPADLTQKGRP